MFASAALVVLSLNSCSSDDNGGVSKSKLVGKWEFSKQKFSAAGQAMGPEQDYDDNEAGCSKDYLMFNADGTIVSGDYFNSDCDLDTTNGIWSLSGKDLTITDGSDVTVMKVSSVSSSKLVIKNTYTEMNVTWTDQYTLLKVAQ